MFTPDESFHQNNGGSVPLRGSAIGFFESEEEPGDPSVSAKTPSFSDRQTDLVNGREPKQRNSLPHETLM